MLLIADSPHLYYDVFVILCNMRDQSKVLFDMVATDVNY